jgi:prepilin-type N-terminal cleavage/methylation domain-containing protein
MTKLMNFILRRKQSGFSLVELLMVIVIMGIIMALVTLSGTSIQSASAQTEAKQLIRSLQYLRSAWLACYADTYQFLDTSLDQMIPRYSDRNWKEETDKYGGITMASDNSSGRIDIGFSGPWNLGSNLASAENTLVEMINNQKADYDISFDVNSRAITIRIR